MSAELLIAILIFIAILLFVFGVYLYIESRKERREIMKRIERMGGEIRSEDKMSILLSMRDYVLRTVASLGDLVKPKGEGEISHLRKTFLKAGYRGEKAPVIFFGTKAFLAILLALGFLLLRFLFFQAMTSLHTMFISILSALVGFYLPNLWLMNKIARRKERLERGFPDALDLMVVCVEAGSGLDAAIHRVGEEMKLSNAVLSDEFQLLSREIRAGKPRREALRNLAIRTDLEDVSSLATLLIQTENFGTSIAQALRVFSDSMRTKRQQRAEEIAARLPVKLVFPLILFIFPSLFVVILGPAAIRILKVLLPGIGGQ